MKHPVHLLAVTLHLAVLCASAFASAASLPAKIQSILQDRFLQRSTVSVAIARLGNSPAADQILLEHNAKTALMPASNQKLLSTSAALEILGGDFRFRTLLVQRGQDLILVGDGDPTLGDLELLRKSDWTVTTVFENWAAALKKTGQNFRQVLVDDSVFDEVFVHPQWPADQEQNRYVAQVAGLSLNGNCLNFTLQTAGAGKTVSYFTTPRTRYASILNNCIAGSDNAVWLSRSRGTNDITLKGTARGGEVVVTIHDPARYCGTVLAEVLAGKGVVSSTAVQRDRTVRAALASGKTHDLKVLAVHETPLSVVLARANKDSVNLYAESLCKRIGHAASNAAGSWLNGPAAIHSFLKRAGADTDELVISDGSGLSRENRISAQAMLRLLRHMFHSPNRAALMGSLSIGGVDGTLDDRFRSPLRGRVAAKSGYIVGVSALSGYLTAKDGQIYAFSILMNGVPRGGNAKAKSLQDAIIAAIDQHAAR